MIHLWLWLPDRAAYITISEYEIRNMSPSEALPGYCILALDSFPGLIAHQIGQGGPGQHIL